MRKGFVRPGNVSLILWFLLLNRFRSSSRRTCSRTEPNDNLQDRLDLTVRPEDSTRSIPGSGKEWSLRHLTQINCFMTTTRTEFTRIVSKVKIFRHILLDIPFCSISHVSKSGIYENISIICDLIIQFEMIPK